MTRQQLLAALVDLGLTRRAVASDSDKIISKLRSIALLRECEGTDSHWAYNHLRKAIYAHLIALVSQ